MIAQVDIMMFNRPLLGDFMVKLKFCQKILAPIFDILNKKWSTDQNDIKYRFLDPQTPKNDILQSTVQQ